MLYAGGSAPLWLEGLAERIGPGGSLTALEADPEKAANARGWLTDAGLPCTVRVLEGNVFAPPFTSGTFDLVYSAGLMHELDVSVNGPEEAIRALVTTLRPGGRLATDDFVAFEDAMHSRQAVQLEDEALEDEMRRALNGEDPYGIGEPGRLISLHQSQLDGVTWQALLPFRIRHLDRLSLAEFTEEEPTGGKLNRRRHVLRERVLREGYTRPSTLYVEGRRPY